VEHGAASTSYAESNIPTKDNKLQKGTGSRLESFGSVQVIDPKIAAQGEKYRPMIWRSDDLEGGGRPVVLDRQIVKGEEDRGTGAQEEGAGDVAGDDGEEESDRPPVEDDGKYDSQSSTPTKKKKKKNKK
jgi:hypothetical protein